MAEPLPPIPPFIAELTGPVLLGHLFNWCLFGALTVQTYLYYLSFPKDGRLPKTLVAFVYFIELLQTVLSTKDAFRNFGTGWGDMNDLNRVGWLWFSVPVLGSIIACTTQIFYAWRISIFSPTKWISAIVVLLSLVQGGAGVWCGVAAHVVGVFSEVQHHSNKPTSVWLGGTALCDVIIAGSMLYYLSKSRSGFQQTNLLLARVIRITLETGLVCATSAILDLVFFLVYPHNNYHLAPSIALSKLYSNSLLVILNSRIRIHGSRDTTKAASEDYSLSFVNVHTTSKAEIPPSSARMWSIHGIDVSKPINDVDHKSSDVHSCGSNKGFHCGIV